MDVATIGSFHHVGIAVSDLGRAADQMIRLFQARKASDVFHDASQGVHVQFVKLGDLLVELLAPAAQPSPVDGVLRRGIALYHVGYEVRDLDGQLASWKDTEVKLVSPPKPAVAFGGRRVAFVMWQGFLVELIEAA